MIDAATEVVITRTAIGPFTSALTVDGGSTVYATSRGDRTVTALTTITLTSLSRASFPDTPGAVAFVRSTGDVIAATSGGAPPPRPSSPETAPAPKP